MTTQLSQVFPFSLFNLGGLSGLQDNQSILGIPPFPLFSTWPFSGQQQTQDGLVSTLPWPVSAEALMNGQVPSGIPLLPPLSDTPDAFVDVIDTMLQAPETALTQSQSALMGQQQQTTSGVTQISSAVRTMMKTMLLAPETVRQTYTGQQDLQTQEQQQEAEENEQQQVFQ